MIGVILAGGQGSRLKPYTEIVNKHLLWVGNKPLICHAFEQMKSLKITDVVVVLGKNNKSEIIELAELYRGHFSPSFVFQKESNGIADAMRRVLAIRQKDRICLILGDNIFDPPLSVNFFNKNMAHIAVIETKDEILARQSGVIYNVKGTYRIIEKPNAPPLPALIATGFYVYPDDILDNVKCLILSQRKEFEITDLNNIYARENRLNLIHYGGYWMDCGTPERILEANGHFADTHIWKK